MGTLALLGSMAFGIIISIVAAVAFLQMTTRGKDRGEDNLGQPIPSTFREVIAQSDPDAFEAEEEMPSWADLTVPLAKDRLQDRILAVGQPRVQGVSGAFIGVSVPLLQLSLCIGRDKAQCGLVYPHGMGEISRKHCTLSFDPDRELFVLEDHGSANGTYLPDGTRLSPGRRGELRPGERFGLSGRLHVFEVQW